MSRSGTPPAASISLPDPTLINDLRKLAASLGYVQGERGSLSGLVAAIGVAAREQPTKTAQRLKFIAKKE